MYVIYKKIYKSVFVILKNLKKVSKYQHLIEKISGAVLIALALYFVWEIVNMQFKLL